MFASNHIPNGRQTTPPPHLPSEKIGKGPFSDFFYSIASSADNFFCVMASIRVSTLFYIIVALTSDNNGRLNYQLLFGK